MTYNQVPYNYTVGVTKRFKGLDLINRVPPKYSHQKEGAGSQDGGGIGRVITFSSTNSLKEQQNGEQSLQNNF